MKMAKLYEIELDRNERDFSTFLRSRNVSLSTQDFKTLIACETIKGGISLFDTERFREKLMKSFSSKPRRQKKSLRAKLSSKEL